MHMIASNFEQYIHDQVASRIGIHAAGQDRVAVDIPLSFPDGDQCRAYVSRSEDGRWRVSDGGATVMRAAYAADVDVLGKGYADRFKQIVQLYGLSEIQGELAASAENDLGDAVFSIAQAAIEIVHLASLPKERVQAPKSLFTATLSRIVTSAIHAAHGKATVEPNWHSESYDPEELYPVDYRIVPAKRALLPLFVFGANSRTACMHATMACLFHKHHKNKFRGIAVYKAAAELPQAEVQRLNMEVDQVFTSTDDKDVIRNYLIAAIEK
jgi:hypothetical protein